MSSNCLTIDIREDAPGKFRAVVLDGPVVLGARSWFDSPHAAEIAGIALVDQIMASRRDQKKGGDGHEQQQDQP